jgi:hypothetical protein
MFGLRYVSLKPLTWTQSIRQYPSTNSSKNVEEPLLSTSCSPEANCDLLLSNGAKLRDFTIQLSIMPGAVSVDDAQRNKFKSDAIGGFWFIQEQGFVHGWFYFKRENFGFVWDQVRTGEYFRCTISLGVDPIQDDDRWRDNPLSIVSASIDFARQSPDKIVDQQPARRGLFSFR